MYTTPHHRVKVILELAEYASSAAAGLQVGFLAMVRKGRRLVFAFSRGKQARPGQLCDKIE